MPHAKGKKYQGKGGKFISGMKAHKRSKSSSKPKRRAAY
jgi:hypothetical protein